MTDNGLLIVLGLGVFAILFSAFLSWAEKDRRTSWRKRKTKTQNKEVI